MERFFHFKEHGTNLKTELLAGITTFMAMAYILMVNSGMFAQLGVVSYQSIYIATGLSAMVGTILIGLFSKLPLAQAPGMGLNAFFVYTVCLGFGLSYANALALVFIEGIFFVLLTVTGIRQKIFAAVPDNVRNAIPAGIGLFIAFLGLQDAGVVVGNETTGVALTSLNIFGGAVTFSEILPVLVTFFSLFLIVILTVRGIRGAVLWGILGGSALYYITGLGIEGFFTRFAGERVVGSLQAFREFGTQAFGQVFRSGFDFSSYLSTHSRGELAVLLLTTALAFCLVDMFDTLGTLYGTCARGGLLDEQGNIPKMEKAMLADATATVFGAVCGTSTVSAYVEASAGIAEGGRTAFTSIVTAVLFGAALFMSPLAILVPGCATASALVFVGILMMDGVRNITWRDMSVALPSFLTIIMMPFTYNISFGIAFGVISDIFIRLFTGKIREIKAGTWIIGGLFAVLFLATH